MKWKKNECYKNDIVILVLENLSSGNNIIFMKHPDSGKNEKKVASFFGILKDDSLPEEKLQEIKIFVESGGIFNCKWKYMQIK